MTDKAVNSNTLTLKKRKPAITEGNTRGHVKATDSSPAPSQPPPAPKPKKPKDYKLQYRGKADSPMAKSHPDWKFLDAYTTLDQAHGYMKARMNGNSLHRMFDYRVIDKDGKECPLK